MSSGQRRSGAPRGRVVRPAPGQATRSAWWWVVPLVLVLLLVAGVWAARFSDLWVVRSVQVRTEAPASTQALKDRLAPPAEVQRASGLRVGDRVATLPRAEVAERVEALPGVEAAEVSRGWAGTVVVDVTLQEAVATHVVDGRRRVLAADGSTLIDLRVDQQVGPEGGDPVPELTVARGVPAGERDAALTAALPTVANLSPQMRERVREYRISEAGLATVVEDSHLVLWGTVPDEADLREREASVSTLLSEQPPTPGATVDASQQGSLVVRAP